MAYNINTKLDSSFYEHWYKPHTEFDMVGPNLIKLPSYYSFDLDKVRKQVREIEEGPGYKPFIYGNRTRTTYQGIGLTAKPGAEDPLYDALGLYDKDDNMLNIKDTVEGRSLIDKKVNVAVSTDTNFSQPTDINTGYIAEVLSKFKSTLTKVRLLNLKRKGILTPHVDYPYYEQIRLHATIVESPTAWWEVEGDRFQIPADGNFYWLDVGKCHAVWNEGTQNRVVLSVNLSPYKDRDGNVTHGPETKLEDLIKDCKL